MGPKHCKKPESKNPPEVWFFETPPVFHWFFTNVNARSPLASIIQVFGHVGSPTARDVLRTPYGER